MPVRLDAIGIVVRDIDRAAAFYQLLGLDFAMGTGDVHIEAVGPGGVRVMLDDEATVKATTQGQVDPVGHRMTLAFHCGTPADVDATFLAMVKAGHAEKSAPWDAFWGQRYAQVVDPDGNVVDLFAPLDAQ